MAVLPENLNPLPLNDAGAALMALEKYIRYMRERIEFVEARNARADEQAKKELNDLKARVKALEGRG